MPASSAAVCSDTLAAAPLAFTQFFPKASKGTTPTLKLTTVTKPSYRMGLTAARILFDIIEDKELLENPQAVILKSRLKIRKSCGNKEKRTDVRFKRDI